MNQSKVFLNCIPSKAAILIILWTAIVGTMYYFALSVAAVSIFTNPLTNTSVSVYTSLLYAILAIAMMFYPLSGFLADVCYGRFKVVRISLCILLLCAFFVCFIEAILIISLKLYSIDYTEYPIYLQRKFIYQLTFILILISVVLFIIGLVGYQANFIQFGLDQLIEAPSKFLALFIHCAIWAFQLGFLLLRVTFSFLLCGIRLKQAPRYAIIFTISFFFSILLLFLLIISRLKHQWFYTEPGQENPYRTVFRVIQFARKHKYPLQRSAFTYGNDYIPSRIDFGKERYGGPFTTEQVENVKTFFRILLVLLALGPTFALEVPSSYLVFPMFGLHALHNHKHIGKNFCDTSEHTWETVFVGSGSLMTMLTIIGLFPVYTWIISRKIIMKNMLLRILVGVILCLLGATSLFITDIVGHLKTGASISNNTHCMFQFHSTNRTLLYPSLNLHWSVLIPPNICLGIGPLIVITTTLEFISAQSPQSMKGFLIGVFFAIRGLFQFLNSMTILPVSIQHPWIISHPPVISCGFIYLLITVTFGLTGLILFSIAAKKYKYRRRDEGMFCQQDVEEIYDRYLTEAPMNIFDED